MGARTWGIPGEDARRAAGERRALVGLAAWELPGAGTAALPSGQRSSHSFRDPNVGEPGRQKSSEPCWQACRSSPS